MIRMILQEVSVKYDFDVAADRRDIGAYKWETIPKVMGEGNADVIPLFVADMDFQIMPEIPETIRGLVDKGIYGYTIPTERYHDSVKKWMEERHRWEIRKEWISVSPGVVSAICYGINAFTSPGDKVIVQQPVYYPFMRSVLSNGREISNNELIYEEGRYTVDFDDLEERAKDPRAKVLLLCSPHNPVGRVWTREELRRMADICLRNEVLIFSDEIHFDLVFPPHKHYVLATLSEAIRDRCIVFTSPSKTFNLAGLQCSNIIIPNPELKERYDRAAEAAGFFTLNSFAFECCITAYEKGGQWYEELMEYLEGNIRFLKEYMEEHLPMLRVVETQGTYLVWVDCRNLSMGAKGLEKFMREKARIFPNEGRIFGKGGEGFERINIACPRHFLEKAMDNLKSAVYSFSSMRARKP